MSLLSDDLLEDLSVHPSLCDTVERYGDQGGLLGIATYVFTYLESADPKLAATAAEIPTILFVSSSVHDDAIDEAELGVADSESRSPADASPRRILNQRVTVGDLVFATLLERVETLPEEFETGRISSSVREIGVGQLEEPAFDPRESSRADAIRRLEQRGSVWGDLVANVVDATGCYDDDDQLERLTTIARNLLFVYTIFDDVEDLPEDVENGVATAPVMLLEADAVDELDSSGGVEIESNDAYSSEAGFDADPDVIVDAVLESDVPERLEALVETREEAIEATARRFHEEGDYSNEAVLEAVSSALAWYCETVCSSPLEESVSERSQRSIRENLSGDEERRREYLESVAHESPFPRVPTAAFGREAATLPGDRLAPAIVRLVHVQTLAASAMPTHLEDALSRLRASRATRRSS